MTISEFGSSVWLGWRRRWTRGGAFALAVLGTVWTITEVTTRVSTQASTWLDMHGALYLGTALLASFGGFLFTAFESRSVTFQIPGTEVLLTLKFTDLFRENGDWLIGVNEFFDSEIGPLVSPNSLHGKLIQGEFKGNSARFRSEVDAALLGHPSEAVVRPVGQGKRYALGTTAILRGSGKNIYLTAIAKTDLQSHRASSSVPILWDGLAEALRIIDNTGNGNPLAMPLIGNGRASIPIPPQHLLRIIVLIITEAAKRHGMPKRITIALADDCFEQLDLPEIKRGWSLG